MKRKRATISDGLGPHGMFTSFESAGQPIRGLVFGKEMAGINFSISDKRLQQLY